MKKLLLLLLIPIIFLVSGCTKEEKQHPFIALHSKPITRDNVFDVEQNFPLSKRIYYLIWNPDGFQSDSLRIQIMKKNEKYSHWGLSLYEANDVMVDTSQKYYRDYFVINQTGLFLVSVFQPQDLKRPLVRAYFWVTE